MTSLLRVLLFAPVLGGGGAEVRIVRLANALRDHQVEPLVAVARGSGVYEDRLDATVPRVVCQRVTKSSTLSAALSFPRLVSKIDGYRPDVVVALQGHLGVPLILAARWARRTPKVVLGIPNNFSARVADAPTWGRRRLIDAERLAYLAADHIVAISQGVAKDFVDSIPAARGKISVVYNAGFDDSLATLSSEPLPFQRPEGPLIVACGRLVRPKDYPTLLRALALVQTKPTPQLWIVGDGREREALLALAAELGVAGQVRMLGFQRNPYPFLANADVFVLSSRHEGFGNVLVEAMACGTRVVSTDCPYGPAEILDSGRYGRLVPVGDAEALARAVDDALVDRPSEAERARVRERAATFSASSSARGYAEVFRRVVGVENGPKHAF